MDLISWIILGAIIVFVVAGLAIWNRARRRSSPIDMLDDATKKDLREAQIRAEQAKSSSGDITGSGMG